jgi:Kdo2-lipid IVA lauroyltransferase/acyltransferase
LRDRLVAFALQTLLRGLGWLSYRATQRLGGIVGDLAYLRNGTLRRVTRTNLSVCFPSLSQHDVDALARESLRHTGRYAAECGIVWGREDQRWKSLIKDVVGVHVIEDAQKAGKGVLVLVPHFGNWEILNLFLGERYGLTALYEPMRIAGLDPIVKGGRTRTGSTLVPTNAGGIRALFGALREGRVVGLLPDQVPNAGGAYAEFFGRAALTMVLVHRLNGRVAPRLVMGHARRLPDAGGFCIAFEALPQLERLKEQHHALKEMNAAIERLVKTDPAQYQWEYKRFKRPQVRDQKIY